MKIDNKKLLGDIDYWDKLNPEEQQFLYEYLLAETYGTTPIGAEPLPEDRKKDINKRRAAASSDIMNVSPHKVLKHLYDKLANPNNHQRYCPEDYPGLSNNPNTLEDDSEE